MRERDPDAEVFLQHTIGDVFRKVPEAREYFSIAFVRNPW